MPGSLRSRVMRWAARRKGAASQRGIILVEALAAIAVTATAGAATLALVSTAALSTSNSGARATASWVAASQAEKIHASVFVPTPGQYEPVSAPAGFTVVNSTADVIGGDPGIQLVAVSVSKAGKELVSVEFVKVNR